MPQIQYPFIDIAVHPAVRARFAAGEAIALFSRDMTQVLWSNGEGAKLFGYADIYGLLDNGPDRQGVSFRQLAATARQLENIGDRRSLMMRVTTGFVSQAVSAEVSMIEIRRGEIVIIFSAPVAANSSFSARIAAMLKGFDDPDTHMAVIDDQGEVLAASPGFAALGVLPETARSLIASVVRGGEGLIKRPIASAAGYLPAAIGKLSIEPPLNLLFCVETVLGRMDPPQDTVAPLVGTARQIEATVEESVSLAGVDEMADLPIEGMVETAGEAEPHVENTTSPSIGEAQAEPLALAQPINDSVAASELAAYQADTASSNEPGETDHIQELPQRIELAADQADTAADSVSVVEPEDHVEAELAPASDVIKVAASADETVDEPGDHQQANVDEPALNDEESDDDIANLAELDSASADDIDGSSLAGSDNDVIEPGSVGMGETEFSDRSASELSADQAEAVSAPEPASDTRLEKTPENLELASDQAEQQAVADHEKDAEPDDDGQAEVAEAALNDGESDEDIANLAELDGATQEDADIHASADEDRIGLEMSNRSHKDVEIDTPTEQPSQVDVPEAATDIQPGTEKAAEEPEFQFRRDGRPVRFVWKLDAHGRFSEVSEEFARTVGPHSGDINGMSYRDLDSLFNLDPNNEITQLLERRDTWSGRTIRWPIEGTDLIVPVDLAALPTYSRNREFDGFRGFGIIRVADAEQDPNAAGMTFFASGQHEEPEAATDAIEEAVQTEDYPPAIEVTFDDEHDDDTNAIVAADTPSEPEDEFRGEVPALKLEAVSLANFSSKIIQLEERRTKSREGLTPNEQNAFREIARQLEPFGKRPNETLNQQSEQPVVEALQSPESAPIEDGRDSAATEHGAQLPDTTSSMDAPETTDEPDYTAIEFSEPVEYHDDEIADDAVEVTSKAAEIAGEEDNAEELDEDIGLTASAADQIPLALLIHAGDRLVHANSEFKRFAGYQSLDLLEASGGLDGLINRHEGPEAGVYMIRADGTQVPVSARLQSVRYEGAKLLMLTLIPAEILPPTEEVIAEDHETARKIAALQVEADELRSILETATDGVVVLDAEGRIRSMNRSASALFNFEDAETRGKPFAMLFAHESQKAVQDYLNGLIGHGVASVLNDGREVIGREASGGFIPLFMTMGRMPGSNSYCAVIRDITQWKRSEEELKAAKRSAETANQHKSDFLARVSHEIRTPLNAIIGFSDMIASEHFGPAGHARYVEYANDIGRSGRHVLDIVNDLLDISKIEAGEMDIEFAAVGINDCVSEAVTLVQPQANAQRVIIRTSLSQSVPDVVADLRSIKQIAINILANAIRFTPSGGQIVVSTAYESNGSVTLRIRDTGVGMSRSELDQAMKPFGQVSPGTRARGDGTGLGLPLTKAMTEANRALFSIQSAQNEGTLVEITFPPQRVLAD